MLIRLENENDYPVTEYLTREAFWNVYRPGCDEHLVLHNFRTLDNYVKPLCYVAEEEGEIVGHIMYCTGSIKCADGTKIEVLEFGPVSVLPRLQKRGIGSALIRLTLDKATELGYGAVAIMGSPDYYHRFGFVSASDFNVLYEGMPESEPAPFFMIKLLKPNYLQGVMGTYKDPDGYFVSPEQVEEFDKQFPTKEKLKLPGQLV